MADIFKLSHAKSGSSIKEMELKAILGQTTIDSENKRLGGSNHDA